MTGDRLNHLNSALMILSCAAAYVFPFELFLLAYAVLGPLHYLTEISWIHDRRYFVAATDDASAREGRRVVGWLALVGLALAVMIWGLVNERLLHRAASPVWEIALFYLVFVAAALFVFRSHPAVAAVAIALTGAGLWAFSASPYYGLIAFLVITIVHVLVFTGAFVLFGAMKARSGSGALSFGIFLACILSIFVIVPDVAVAAGGLVKANYAPFALLNEQLIRLFGLGGSGLEDVYQSRAGAIVMRLIAFAYTYHYLNWFTKTSVIGWHRITTRRAGVIAALWVAALAIYAYDYLLGFAVLYALSVLHVMLELPLNHQSFAGIGREFGRLLFPPQLALVPAKPQPSRAQRRAAQAKRRR